MGKENRQHSEYEEKMAKNNKLQKTKRENGVKTNTNRGLCIICNAPMASRRDLRVNRKGRHGAAHNTKHTSTHTTHSCMCG